MADCTLPTWLLAANAVTNAVGTDRVKWVRDVLGGVLVEGIPVDRAWDLLALWAGPLGDPGGVATSNNYTPFFLQATKDWAYQQAVKQLRPRFYQHKLTTPAGEPPKCIFPRAYTAAGDFALDWTTTYTPKHNGPSAPVPSAPGSHDYTLAGYKFWGDPPGDRTWLDELSRVGYPVQLASGIIPALQLLFARGKFNWPTAVPFRLLEPLTPTQKTELRTWQTASGIPATGTIDNATLGLLVTEFSPSAIVRQTAAGTPVLSPVTPRKGVTGKVIAGVVIAGLILLSR